MLRRYLHSVQYYWIQFKCFIAKVNAELLPKIVTQVTNLGWQPDDFVALMHHKDNDEIIKMRGATPTNRLPSVICPLSSDAWHDYCLIFQQHTSCVLTDGLAGTVLQPDRTAIRRNHKRSIKHEKLAKRFYLD